MKSGAEAVLRDAQEAHRAGRWAEAETLYRRLLEMVPGRAADVAQWLAIVCAEQGKLEEGAALMERVTDARPEDAAAWCNRGEMLRRAGRPGEAERCLDRALALAPEFPEAHFNLANARRALGRWEEAETGFRRVLELAPGHAGAAFNLGNLYLDGGRFRSAIEAFERAIQIRPDHVEAHCNLGIALGLWNRDEEAVRHYEHALELRPDYVPALRNLGDTLERQGQAEAAVRMLRRAAMCGGNTPLAELRWQLVAPLIWPSNAAIDGWRSKLSETLEGWKGGRLAGIAPDALVAAGVEPPCGLPYQGRDDRGLKEQFAAVFEPVFARAQETAGPSTSQGQGRIGFVVSSGHEGVFLKGMRGMALRLAARGWRVTVVCTEPNGRRIVGPSFQEATGIAAQAVSRQGGALEILQVPRHLEGAAELMKRGEFSVLFHWEVGTDAFNYFLPYLRLAPMQVVGWGWPVTSGTQHIQAMLACDAMERPGAEEDYTEQLVRWNRIPAYYLRPKIELAERKERSAFGLPERGRLYLCHQNVRKVHPDFDVVVQGILERDGEGIVVMLEDRQWELTRQVKQRMAAAMPATADRIRWLPRLAEPAYWGLLGVCDVAVDTLHYGAGANTCYDAFAMGLPMVTAPGRFQRGRFASAALRQMGVTGLEAADAAGLAELAVAVAGDRDRREAMSRAVREGAESELFEDEAAVDEWDRWMRSI